MSRSKAKTFTQPDKYSCGPAALKNAMRIIGIRKSYAEVETLCKTTKNGTSVKNLIKAANRLGLFVLSMEKTTLTHLQSALKPKTGIKRAVIVDYLYKDEEPHEETGHYATVASYSPRSSRLFLLDSYSGTKKSYLWVEFLDRWYDYEYQRIKAKTSINKKHLHKKWYYRLMLVVSKTESGLPKFRDSVFKIYTPNPSQ